MHAFRTAIAIIALLAGCSSEIYLRDGVTDGDTFYLADYALTDDDPVLQSWVSYSLTLSACKLMIGGDNPARASSFECELTARRHLLDTWIETRRDGSDAYLDMLVGVREAGWLPEYVASNFGKPAWQLPEALDLAGYRQFASESVRRHQPATRIIGSWNYARNVEPAR